MTTSIDSVTATVPARAHLAGNPSDGYGGAVLSVTVPSLAARVVVDDADAFAVSGPTARWASIDELVQTTTRHGHDGGDRLVTAALVRLHRLVPEDIERRPGRFRWSTTIPRSVGLGGSSALVIATMRAALTWWRVPVEPDDLQLATAALAAEVDELGISAGLADRAAQVLGGVVLTDCRAEEPVATQVPVARPVMASLLWNPAAAAPSGEYHGELRARLEAGDRVVAAHLARLARCADEAGDALAGGDLDRFTRALAESLTLRERMGSVPAPSIEGVDGLRAAGAAVNFAGSGGALVVVGPCTTPEGWTAHPLSIGASRVPAPSPSTRGGP